MDAILFICVIGAIPFTALTLIVLFAYLEEVLVQLIKRKNGK